MLRRLLALAFLLALAPSAAAAAEPPGAAPSVVGGADAAIADWPSIAFVLSGWDTDADGAIDRAAQCTGTLVAPRWVLTAAHCAFGPDHAPVDAMLAVMGSADVEAEEAEVLAADDVAVHPDWDPFMLKGDVLLVHLEADSVQPPMQLARPQVEYFLDAGVPNLAGWGTIDEDSEVGTNVLQEAFVTIIDLRDEGTEECASHDPGGYDPSTQTCALEYGVAGACHGDSGGPLTVLDAEGVPRLWGLTSYGPPAPGPDYKECDLRVPAIFSWVPAFADWIDMEIGAVEPPPPGPGPQQPGPPAPPPSSPLPTTPADIRAPILRDVTLGRKRIRAARKGAMLARRKAGTTLSFFVDEAAAVSVTVLKRGKPRGTPAILAADMGITRKRFTARVGGKRLKRGRYALRVGAVDAAGNAAAPVTIRFKVV